MKQLKSILVNTVPDSKTYRSHEGRITAGFPGVWLGVNSSEKDWALNCEGSWPWVLAVLTTATLPWG